MIAVLSNLVAVWFMRKALMGIGQLIYDYQTLITGVGAIGAAYIAARPVYSQLSMMRTQSDGVLREMLLQRQLEVRQAHDASQKKVGERLSKLAEEYYWDEAPDELRLSEPQAHFYGQHISGAASWLRRHYQWRDNVEAEGAKNDLVEKLDRLIHILNDISAPASTDQVDEDRAILDDQWTAFLQRGEDAKIEVYPALREARSALTAFHSSLQNEDTAIGQQLKQLDRSLVKLS